MRGPLIGVRIVELGAIGPGPHAAMLLADLGADVVRLERPGSQPLLDPTRNAVLRGRRSVDADLRDPTTLATAMSVIEAADVLIDGFRPGVTDQLGIGPEALRSRNPRLIYGRMTGWGVGGPLSQQAGHDINFLAITGVLHAIARKDAPPTVPLNLVGDYGGGSLYLVVGILAALLERESSGRGQVVDASIVDGVTSLAQMIWSLRGQGMWSDEPASNLLDSGAPFYDTYICADGRYVAVGAIEAPFYAALLRGLGLDPAELPDQHDVSAWPQLRLRFEDAFMQRTRDEWEATFDGTDACVTPVLTFSEAARHPHLVDRAAIIDRDGLQQAGVAPRLSRSRPPKPSPPPEPGSTSLGTVLSDWEAIGRDRVRVGR